MPRLDFAEVPAFAGIPGQAAAASPCFLAISRFRRRALRLSESSLDLSSQLSRPPTCSTDLRPFIDTRSLTPRPSASLIKVTFCRLGRKVRLVLLLAWETLWPTCRPLPVSSQMRDIFDHPDMKRAREATRK